MALGPSELYSRLKGMRLEPGEQPLPSGGALLEYRESSSGSPELAGARGAIGGAEGWISSGMLQGDWAISTPGTRAR